MGSLETGPNESMSELRRLATGILAETNRIESLCNKANVSFPSLEVGARVEFWSEDNSDEIAAHRTTVLGYLEKLTALIQGPHGYLHEYVASNWDHGALYVFLRSGLLQSLSSARLASLSDLSKQSDIPEDKLVRILGLLKCKHIVHEPKGNLFALTAISEELVKDADFSKWVEFQLFETRVASAHLADALSVKPNSYAQGISGFKQGWGLEMYEWHARHVDKGERFRRAMKGVSQTLDPADDLLRSWLNSNKHRQLHKIVELGGRYGFASTSLASDFRDASFEIRCETKEFLLRAEASLKPECSERVAFRLVDSFTAPSQDAQNVSVYLLRNLLWNWSDDEAVKLLQAILPTLRTAPSTCIVITDGVSPVSGECPAHLEVGYRRRDITTMTMHNVKQRNRAEWLNLFARLDPAIKVTTAFQGSSHVYKGLWELSLDHTKA